MGSLKTVWITTPKILPPSSAGIGRMLKIARDKDIIHIKAKKDNRHHCSSNVCQNLTAPTGQETWFNEDHNFLLLNEIIPFHIRPKAVSDNTDWACISCTDAIIAFHSPNLIVGFCE